VRTVVAAVGRQWLAAVRTEAANPPEVVQNFLTTLVSNAAEAVRPRRTAMPDIVEDQEAR
jgi:hypothetical protein